VAEKELPRVGATMIGNNRGRINGWTSQERVFGLCVDVEGVARKKVDGKLIPR
jgi:hypothetical protein